MSSCSCRRPHTTLVRRDVLRREIYCGRTLRRKLRQRCYVNKILQNCNNYHNGAAVGGNGVPPSCNTAAFNKKLTKQYTFICSFIHFNTHKKLESINCCKCTRCAEHACKLISTKYRFFIRKLQTRWITILRRSSSDHSVDAAHSLQRRRPGCGGKASARRCCYRSMGQTDKTNGLTDGHRQWRSQECELGASPPLTPPSPPLPLSPPPFNGGPGV